MPKTQDMIAKTTLRPGQKGTKHLMEKYGERLICVRYRYDETTHKRYTTVELIEAEATWTDTEAQPPEQQHLHRETRRQSPEPPVQHSQRSAWFCRTGGRDRTGAGRPGKRCTAAVW